MNILFSHLINSNKLIKSRYIAMIEKISCVYIQLVKVFNKSTCQFKQNNDNNIANPKQKQNALIILLLIIISSTSCMKEIEEISWDVKNESSMLVVDGSVTNELKNHGIRLTLSSNYFSNKEPLPVHGASVNVSMGNNNYAFTESPDNTGWYYSDEFFEGIPDETYDLHISLQEAVNGQSIYTSSSRMPQGLDIDSMYCLVYKAPEEHLTDEEEEGEEQDTIALLIYYFGYEPESDDNYYLAQISRNNEKLFPNIKDYDLFTDDHLDPYNNNLYLIKNVEDSDPITLDLYCISKKYHNYIDALKKIDETGNIYSPQGPPANAIGNIEGALGYFAATYISSSKSNAVKVD